MIEKIKISKLKIYAILVTILLAVCFIYFIGIQQLEKYCDECKNEGFQNTLQGLVNEVKKRGGGIEIKVGENKLICDVRE